MRDFVAKRGKKIWCEVWIFALVAFCVSGNGETFAAFLTNETENAGVYSLEPLDPGATKVTPGYRGHDVEAILESVSKIFSRRNVEKDEYEKTVDFQKRLATFKKTLPEKTLHGNLKFGSTLALALTQDAKFGFSARCQYDADAERFAISFESRVDYGVEGFIEKQYKDFYGVGIKRELIPEANDGNRNSIIKRECWRSCGIVFTDSRDLRIDASSTLYLHGVAPNYARTIGKGLGVLCVFQLGFLEKREDGTATPYAVVRGTETTKPTTARPNGTFESKQAVLTTLPEFWIYNVKTGEVYAKYALADLKNGKSKKIGDFHLEELEKAEKNKEKERQARQASAFEEFVKHRRRQMDAFLNDNLPLTTRVATFKMLPPSRRFAAPTTIAVPKDFATLREALDEATKKAGKDAIPRIVLDAGEYDASGLTLKTLVDIQSASGNPEDVVLNVDAAAPIVVNGETVVEFDGVTLRQVNAEAKTGSCVEVKQGIALLYNCVFDGKSGAKAATGVKASGRKSAVVCWKYSATGFSLSALHVEAGAFGYVMNSVLGPNNRFGASSKGAWLKVEECEIRVNETGVYFGKYVVGGAQGNVYAENKRDAQIVDGAKVEVDAPNVDAEK
ncbi:MAG: hypothetical protein J6K25_05170 [Thermoguttaceae bacterium]|nr:hypothetical protein [Thermoguttaceae bacterium]